MPPTEIICGTNAVLEVLRAGKRRAHEVYVAVGKRDATIDIIAREAAARGVHVREVTRQQIQDLSRVEKNQGVAARVDVFAYDAIERLVRGAKEGASQGFIVVLDEIVDPQNLGSLTRTAHLTGAAGLVIPKDRAAPIGPAATRAAAGATEYLPIAQVTNIATTLEMLKKQGFWVVGAEGTAEQCLYDYDFTGAPHVLVMGGEGTGLRRLVRENCDAVLSIPLTGAVGSYNVSVAGAIFMAEVMRQQRFKSVCKNRT